MNDIEILEISPHDTVWATFLEKTPHLLFHTPQWCDALSQGFGGPSYCLLFRQGETVVAGVAGTVVATLGFRVFMANFPYGGILYAPGAAPVDSEILAQLLSQWSKSRKIMSIRLVQPPGTAAPTGGAFKAIPMTSQVVDISQIHDSESLLKSYKKSHRRNVRRALRNNISVLETSHAEHISAFYGLYVESMKRNNAPIKYTLDMIQSIVSSLTSTKSGALIIAKHEDKIIGGIIIADSDVSSHYLFSGINSHGIKYCASEVLLQYAITRAVYQRKQHFDLLPSGNAADSLRQFKAKWGAMEVPAPVADLEIKPLESAMFNGLKRMASTSLGRTMLRTLRGSKS